MPLTKHRLGSRGAPRKISLPGSSRFNLKSFRQTFGLKQDMVARMTGCSLRALANWSTGKPPSQPHAQRLQEISRFCAALSRVVQPESIEPWLRTPNDAFDGSTPLQVIERGEIDRLWRMIYRLESGEPG